MHFLSLLFLIIIWSFPSYAFANRSYDCSKYKETEITINKIISSAKTDHNHNLYEIRKIALKNKTDIALSKEETPVGLTSAALIFETQYQIITSKSSNDIMTCAQIKKIKINFGFEKTTIYMPIEIKENTCEYNSVLNHEKKHVKKDLSFIKYAYPYIKKDIINLMRKIGVIRSGSSTNAKRRITKKIDDKMNYLAKKYSSIRHKMQRKIDTPQEYKRLSNSCHGRIKNIVRKSKL